MKINYLGALLRLKWAKSVKGALFYKLLLINYLCQ